MVLNILCSLQDRSVSMYKDIASLSCLMVYPLGNRAGGTIKLRCWLCVVVVVFVVVVGMYPMGVWGLLTSESCLRVPCVMWEYPTEIC